MVQWPVAVVALSLLIPVSLSAQKNQPPAQSLDELWQQLEKILKDTKIPGVSIAIVHRDGPEWVGGLGKSDVAGSREVTPETLFRIGSTSKAFASLSILTLANQGKLSLDDPVHKLAPEVWFENRWESTDPVRVVHLLEHTTGWDDMHLREYAKDTPPTMGLREALDYDHHSRISRWRPGTRFAYCNSGPAVAAYIVEKLTGQRFEDFVEQNFFRPIGMETATYFPTSPGTATTLYHYDGVTPYPYWNILYRPAGSINASAKDMAAYIQFYLNRGAVNGVQVVPATNIDRMENPASTWAAKEGMKAGYGLSNYWSIQDGYVYHGHDGGVAGGLTEMAYMPEYGVGYFFSINSENSDGFDRVGKTIRAYITHNLQKPPLPPVAPLPANAAEYVGWYEPDSPRIELTHFLERLTGLSHIRFENGKLLLSSLGESNRPLVNRAFLPVAGEQFRRLPKEESPEPVSTLVLLAPKRDGQFIEVGWDTMKHVPAWFAIGEILLTAWFLLAVVSILVYAPFWLLGGLNKKRRRPAERAMRIWPLLAVLSLLAALAIFNLASDDLIAHMGDLTAWSATGFMATIAYAVACVASAISVWRAPKNEVRSGFRRYSIAVTLGLLIAAAYLAYWGMIGLRTWA
jgi:CubicO group peptidase (beta-lactamase class C family)